MQLADGLLQSGTFWSILFGLLGAIGGAAIGAYYNARLSNPKQVLEYRWLSSVSLLNARSASGTPASLTVKHGTTNLTEARVVELLIKNSDKSSIIADDFHGGKPIEIGLDSKIIDIIDQRSSPPTAAPPTVNITSQDRIESGHAYSSAGSKSSIRLSLTGEQTSKGSRSSRHSRK
ncbi:hypothetical protein OHB06_00815 [Streptomyces sp. NBC_01604]|uniref:hypothetical protein n=1 Tax=Streptomyces sp. NBC_01604 TaxID=2975894 RepID=UPI0038709694